MFKFSTTMTQGGKIPDCPFIILEKWDMSHAYFPLTSFKLIHDEACDTRIVQRIELKGVIEPVVITPNHTQLTNCLYYNM